MNRSSPAHAPMHQFPVHDGCLQVGGIPLPQLAARVGRTPFYVYDRRLMTERVAELREVLPSGVSLHFAMKANPMPAVVAHMVPLVDGIDVASAGELRVALDAGAAPGEISFAGPGKQPRELRTAVAADVTLNIESPLELERLVQISTELGRRAKVAVRVNPDFELKSSGMKMGGGPKVFGIDAELIPDVLHRIRETGLEFRGFHIYTGSQNLRHESITEAHDHIFELAYRLAQHAPGPVHFLNIGGGFGIPYFPGDQRLDLEPVAERLRGHLETTRQRLGETRVVLELGRYLVGEAGLYVARIIDRKVSRGQVFLVSDGGLHHHLAASGNFGQVIRKNYPVAIGNRMDQPAAETVTITGPLCTPLDLLAANLQAPVAQPGDLTVVYQSGAYGFTASPMGFLSHPPALQILV